MNMLLWIICGTLWALFGIGAYLELWTAAKFERFGQREAAKILSDRYGYLSQWKFAACIAIAAALSIAGVLYAGPVGGIVAVIGPTIVSLAYGLSNWQNQSKMRKSQILALRTLRDTGSFKFGSFWIRNKGMKYQRARYQLIGWIFSDEPDIKAARVTVEARIRTLSALPENMWFE